MVSVGYWEWRKHTTYRRSRGLDSGIRMLLANSECCGKSECLFFSLQYSCRDDDKPIVMVAMACMAFDEYARTMPGAIILEMMFGDASD